MIAFYLRAVLWDVMPCVCSHELDWVGGLEPQDPLREEKFEKTAGWVARLMERPLCFMRETGAPGLPLEPSKDVASCFGRRGYLPRSRCSSGDCAGGRVGEGCLRCFVCRYFGSVDGSVEHRPTCIGAVPGLWFHYTIPASWLGQVSKCRVWSGPTRQQLVRQALLFVPDGLPEAVENRLYLPFHGGPPSQWTYLRRFRKAWNGRIGTLPVTASLPIHVLQEKAWNWSGWVGLVPNFENSSGTPIWGPHGSGR